MNLFKTIADVRSARGRLKELALVPTMGALHAGHLSLIKLAAKRCRNVAVSIFVNPTQFGPREDFNRYPRPLEEDLSMCRAAGATMVFNPEPQELYPGFGPQQPGVPQQADVIVDLPQLTGVLEGKHRPGHFRGVCQVVAKLFNIFQPTYAVFGEKDFQQLRVISAMVEALNWPIEIIPGPTLRDPDGLAMSSRNQYLTPEERERALSISRALNAASRDYLKGIKQTNRLITTMQHILLEQHLSIDYIAAVDPATLKNVDLVDGKTVFAIAARVGNTRLIDNITLGQ